MTIEFFYKSDCLLLRLPFYRGNCRLPGVHCSSRGNRRRQVPYSYQIVSRGGEDEHPAHPLYASVTSFPEIAHGFDPAKDSFTLAPALANGVARMTGGPAIDGRGTLRTVLSHMRHSLEGTQGLNKLPGFITLSTRPRQCGAGLEGPPSGSCLPQALWGRYQHRWRRKAFRCG